MRRPLRSIHIKQSTPGYQLTLKQWPAGDFHRFILYQHCDMVALNTRDDLILLRDALDDMIVRSAPVGD